MFGACVGSAERRGHGAVRITQQIVREIEFAAKCLVVFYAVEAHTHNLRVMLVKVLDSITEPFTFDGSARGIGFRIPPQQDVTAAEIIQGHGLPCMICNRELRRFGAGFNQ